ncbi:GxxExxY protein [Maribellus sp. YY47]|uniref:GxxExxY protein n=1 Tax=Maribellus sp. YY47 TaxID=2929486 RepID=UPI0020010C96|nr:GxxExxY protein [Maribellus sp. YY47]MCK3685208.1 GxxExxY protein [Maribellus sp. YY47]
MELSENQISYDIRGAIFEVYNTLGPGLLESVYEAALIYELREMGYDVDHQVELPVNYKGKNLEKGFRIDILVENKVIIEIKSVETMNKLYFKQTVSYLKLADKKLGILVNFNTDNISSAIQRIANNI